jgi:mRNA interferase RelE/StbE
MNLLIDQSFAKDIQKIDDKKLRRKIASQIEFIKGCVTPAEIVGLKKLKGFKQEYRLRLGDYRIGLKIKGEEITLIRFLHRKELYKYFP